MCGEGAPVDGIMPLIDHDVLFADIAAGDPDDPNDDFTFGMMAEEGTGICEEHLPLICYICDGGTIWCPCNDPQVHAAKKVLELCLRSAKRVFALVCAGAAAELAIARTACWASGPVAFVACIAAAKAIALAAIAVAGVIYHGQVQDCWAVYRIALAAAAGQGCAPP
jgi:hypothetical protein